MLCLGILLMICFPDSQRTSPSDSFCQVYSRVLQEPADAAGLRTSTDGVRRRTAANDVNYRCLCEGWKDPICKRG